MTAQCNLSVNIRARTTRVSSKGKRASARLPPCNVAVLELDRW